ncbi:hypothetical protein LDENG_00209970 [Lucifuga dentata]|nr:hypothetical protein LDENG_00209970 [Lucifuga dentata]
MLRLREELENGAAWSNSSESSDDSSSPQLSAAGPRSNTHHTAAAASSELQPGATGSSSLQPDISFSLRDSASSTPNSTSKVNAISHMTKDQGQSKREEENGPVSTVMKPVGERVHRGKESSSVAVDGAGLASCSYSRSLSLISESSADGVVCTDTSACRSDEETHLTSRLSTEEIEIEMPNGTPQAPGSLAVERVTVDEENATTDVSDPHRDEKQHGKENMEVHVDKPSSSLTSAMFRNGSVASSPPATPHVETSAVSESLDVTYAARRVTVEEEMLVVDSGLEDALGALVSSLDDYRGQFPELQLLEQELKLLQVTLKGGTHSRSPSVVSLTVETALGSFDFLNTSDCEEEEEETGEKRSRSGRSLQDARRDGPSSPTAPLTTGCPALDCSLVVHLKNCSSQLLRLGTFGPLRCGEMFALDRLLREAGVLQIIRRIAKSDPSPLTQPAEVVPELERCRDAVSLWQQCVQHDDVFSVSADRFVAALSKIYSAKLPERAASMADAVFLCVVERVLDQRLPRRCSSRDKVTVTVFQLWSYLQANGVYDMDAHVTELANEVWLVQILASREQEVIVHALRRSSECRLQREGLHAVAKLLRDPSSKVSAAAISVLRSLASQSTRRETAVVSCLELLEDQNLDTRVCGCKALACLKAKESIEQLVYLCRTDKEEVRDASKQALLVLGEEGKMAFRHVETSQDSIPRLFAPGSMASTAF